MESAISIKLKAFHIQHYRSVVDTGWTQLANDNITVIIGQNESGKTSILEALKSFHEGIIHDDVLRSDLSLPLVSCKFQLLAQKVSGFINRERTDELLFELLSTMEEVTLTRIWNENKSSQIYISNPEILEYFEHKEKEKVRIEEETSQQITNLLKKSEEYIQQLGIVETRKIEAQKELISIKKRYDLAQKNKRKARKADLSLIADKELDISENLFNKATLDLKVAIEELEQIKLRTQEISEKVSVCNRCNDLVNSIQTGMSELDKIRKQLKNTEHHYDIATNDRDKKGLLTSLDKLSGQYELHLQKQVEAKRELDLQKLIASKVLSGTRLIEAEALSKKQLHDDAKLYDQYDLGEDVFKHMPNFLFFEDFSSLLPNKIDLEDVLSENHKVEGYKAAQNFLRITGLDAEFFREKNHRILKQKIENLNGSFTINFQDYWSQQVGKNSKITINFELEHYDYKVPEKSGKPYIEFWIKDRNERLYPKQRSRGVRWFLSSYLELKATALDNNQNRILLIDEPGLSLHARAQEDVLKVFEDISKYLQVMYCTHSPYLVDIEKLYRILAVQRADEQDDRSETVIFNPNRMAEANFDTLSPIYSLMGARLSNQQFIHAHNNILLADKIDYLYLSAFCRLVRGLPEMHFIPATGISNIPSLVNIFVGWGLGFTVLLFNDEMTQQIITDLKENSIFSHADHSSNALLGINDFSFVEDLFSTLDFKKYILNERVGITELNSVYIQNKGLSRSILASGFISTCQEKNLSLSDFDDESQANIHGLIEKIKQNLR